MRRLPIFPFCFGSRFDCIIKFVKCSKIDPLIIHHNDSGPFLVGFNYINAISTRGVFAAHSFVSGLLYSSCPSAVFRRIRAIIINAIYGVLGRWPASHVGIKRFKAVTPCVANSNSSPTVKVKVGAGFFVTPLFYVAPCFMLNSSCHTMSEV